MDESNVTIVDSALEYMWLGAGLRLDDSATGYMKRCDIKECTYGISLYHNARCVVDTCAVLNCTFGAYHQGSDKLDEDENDDENNCALTLRNTQVIMCAV
jgi:hypothetical protein